MAKSKILIVDDDPGILAMLQLMLRLEGYDALSAGNPAWLLIQWPAKNPIWFAGCPDAGL